MPVDKAGQLAGSDPDYNNRKLYNAIANGNPVGLLAKRSNSITVNVTIKSSDPITLFRQVPREGGRRWWDSASTS